MKAVQSYPFLLVSSLFVYYIHFLCFLGQIATIYLSFIISEYLNISCFQILFLFFVHSLSLACLSSFKKKNTFPLLTELVFSTCSFITLFLFLKSLHPHQLWFSLSLSQICASSVRSVNLSAPTSLTAHPPQYHY